MKKTLCIIICAVLALTLVIAACLYFIPKSTPIDISLNALKLDGKGNEVGTVPISIKGNLKEYLFRPDSLDIDVTSSDELLNWDSHFFDIIPDDIDDFDYVDYYVGFRHAGFIKDENITINLYFSSNLNRWMFEVFDKTHDDPTQPMIYLKAIYIASTKKVDTWDKISEFFEPVYPFVPSS